jgi:hypothetical protein
VVDLEGLELCASHAVLSNPSLSIAALCADRWPAYHSACPQDENLGLAILRCDFVADAIKATNSALIIVRSVVAESGNNTIQKGLAISRERSGTIGNSARLGAL